jgi:hypothetical protein
MRFFLFALLMLFSMDWERLCERGPVFDADSLMASLFVDFVSLLVCDWCCLMQAAVVEVEFDELDRGEELSDRGEVDEEDDDRDEMTTAAAALVF